MQQYKHRSQGKNHYGRLSEEKEKLKKVPDSGSAILEKLRKEGKFSNGEDGRLTIPENLNH